MNQGKGRGAVIMDEHKYTEKCLEMLNTKRFSKISVDRRKRQRQRSKELYEKSKANLRSRNISFMPYRFLSWKILWYHEDTKTENQMTK